MEKLLRDATNKLYKLNDLLEKKALSKDDINAEENNYLYFLQIQAQLITLLSQLQQSSLDNKNEYTKNILKLYLLTRNLYEYCENMHDNVRKLMGQTYEQFYAKNDSQRL